MSVETRAGGAKPQGALDAVLVVILLVGTVLYLAGLPRVLGESDEGLYLYEAKRLLEGQVFYRDVFDLITPGAHYLMAGLFWAFGPDIATARLADAAMHGLIVALAYLTCRALGVRRGLSVVAALADPAFFRPAWTVSSPHWLATLLGLALLYVLVARPGRALAAGIVAGLVVAVQQQKGVLLGAGAGVAIVAGELTRRGGAAMRRLAAFLGGLLLVVVPLVVGLAAAAGAADVFHALVTHPLVNYRGFNRVAWGYVGPVPWHTRYVFPATLAWLVPALAGLMVLRAVVALRGGGARARQSLVLAVMAVASIGSILYYPDYIHLAFIGPLFAVVAADCLEWGLGRLARRSEAARPVGLLVAALLLLGTGMQLGRVAVGSRRDYPFTRQTAFGRLDFHDATVVDLIEQLEAAVRASGSREMFVYPFGTWLYLVTGTTNPTPYQILLPGYSGADQLAHAVEILERRRVPLVLPALPLRPGGLVDDYVLAHYEPVPDRTGRPILYRRR